MRIAFVCALLATVVSAGGEPGPVVGHEPFDRLLGKHVRDERVDYAALARADRGSLDDYLDSMAAVDPDGLSRDDRLAYYINLYNATMIRVVTQRYRPDFSVSERSFALFDEPLVRLRGEEISLNHLEHEIIRPGFNDPRIHAALVCAARSCPPLIPRAYLGDDLDRVLDENMQRFLSDPSRNVIEPGRIALSRIFDWYAEDFGGKDGVRDYVRRFVPAVPDDAAIEFLEYSWELNATGR